VVTLYTQETNTISYDVTHRKPILSVMMLLTGNQYYQLWCY